MTPNPAPENATKLPEVDDRILAEDSLHAIRRAVIDWHLGKPGDPIQCEVDRNELLQHIRARERQYAELVAAAEKNLKTIAFAWRGLTYKLCDGPVCRCCHIDALSITGSQLPDRHLPNCHVLLLDKALSAALAALSPVSPPALTNGEPR